MLDSPSNSPVGSFAVGNTGGWSTWKTIPANISKVTGTHNVYLVFVSGAGGNQEDPSRGRFRESQMVMMWSGGFADSASYRSGKQPTVTPGTVPTAFTPPGLPGVPTARPRSSAH